MALLLNIDSPPGRDPPQWSVPPYFKALHGEPRDWDLRVSVMDPDDDVAELTFSYDGDLPYGFVLAGNGVLTYTGAVPPGDWAGWPTSRVRHRFNGRFVKAWFMKRWPWRVFRDRTGL